MSFDPDLVDRLEAALLGLGAQPQRRSMFGGVALMVNGNMCIGTARGALHVRVGREAWTEALARPEAREMDFTGRVMAGWVTVDGAADLDEDAMGHWAKLALDFARTLSAK